MTDEEDVKALLGKAIGPEPPLHLDRAEILRKGRRGVRVRRFATSGGVAAAVVTVVLGAAALSNTPGVGSDDDVSPAQATSTGQSVLPTPPISAPVTAPAGPQLPLTTTTPAPPTARTRAADLTQALAEAGVIPNTVELRDPGNGSGVLAFVFANEAYLASANVIRPDGNGNLRIQLRRPNRSAPVSCAGVGADAVSCTIATDYGLLMMVAVQRADGGVLSFVVHTVRPDGTDVLVTSGNTVTNRTGYTVSGPTPPIDVDVLKRIAALPGLTFG